MTTRFTSVYSTLSLTILSVHVQQPPASQKITLDCLLIGSQNFLLKRHKEPNCEFQRMEYNMSQTEDERKLPELQMNQDELEQLRSRYVELIGYVPPRIQART